MPAKSQCFLFLCAVLHTITQKEEVVHTPMDHRADLYVLPHPKGGWQVRRHAAAKAIRRVASYQEALEIAARMAANEQLSLLARYRPAGEPSA